MTSGLTPPVASSTAEMIACFLAGGTELPESTCRNSTFLVSKSLTAVRSRAARPASPFFETASNSAPAYRLPAEREVMSTAPVGCGGSYSTNRHRQLMSRDPIQDGLGPTEQNVNLYHPARGTGKIDGHLPVQADA